MGSAIGGDDARVGLAPALLGHAARLSGLVINDCTLHEKDDRRWIGLPGKPQIEDGRQRTDPATGKGLYTPVIEIPDRDARSKFQELALAAVDRLLHTGGGR